MGFRQGRSSTTACRYAVAHHHGRRARSSRSPCHGRSRERCPLAQDALQRGPSMHAGAAPKPLTLRPHCSWTRITCSQQVRPTERGLGDAWQDGRSTEQGVDQLALAHRLGEVVVGAGAQGQDHRGEAVDVGDDDDPHRGDAVGAAAGPTSPWPSPSRRSTTAWANAVSAAAAFAHRVPGTAVTANPLPVRAPGRRGCRRCPRPEQGRGEARDTEAASPTLEPGSSRLASGEPPLPWGCMALKALSSTIWLEAVSRMALYAPGPRG